MEHYLLVILQWAGRIIGQKLAGTILNLAGKRLSPLLDQTVKTLGGWRKQHAETMQIAKNAGDLNAEAQAALEELLAKNQSLKAEIAELRTTRAIWLEVESRSGSTEP